MDGRAESRFPAKFDMTLVDLAHQDQKITGRGMEVSPSGLRVLLPVPLEPATPLKLEIAGNSLFGVVVYSNAEGPEFQTGIEITRVLFGENDLSKLLHSLLAEEASRPAPREK